MLAHRIGALKLRSTPQIGGWTLSKILPTNMGMKNNKLSE